jgi:hypothetical protein
MAIFRYPLISGDRDSSGESAHKNAHNSPIRLSIPTRIAWGEYEHPEKYPKTTIYARREYLRIIERECPRVLRDLARTVRPHYEKLRREANYGEFLGLTWNTTRRKHVALARALDAWGARYNLNAEWAYNVALGTLFSWTSQRITDYAWRWDSEGTGRPFTDEEVHFEFTFPSWDPITETEASYKARLHADFGNRSKYHFQRLKELAKERGWQKTREIRPSRVRKGARQANTHPYRHFYYLAYWQVNQWPYSRIANNEPLWPETPPESISGTKVIRKRNKPKPNVSIEEVQRIRQGIAEAARLVGLKVRKGKGGRPGTGMRR